MLGYSIARGEGVISGDDGARYLFTLQEWKSDGHPSASAPVDFIAQGTVASAIYFDSATSNGRGTAKLTTGSRLLDERYTSLYCSSDEIVLFGLCGGLAHKFGLPAVAIRFAVFVLLFFFVGWLYFVGIFLPKLPTKGVPRQL